MSGPIGIERRATRRVIVDGVAIGSGAPIVVQSMTNTDTADVAATVAQVKALADAGSELVRITVNTAEAAAAVPAIRERLDAIGCDAPLVGDFHFNGHKLLTEHPGCAAALAKYRINPGNVGKGSKRDPQFAVMIEQAIRYGKPVRIGVNWGSLDADLLARMMDENAARSEPASADLVMREALVVSAVGSAQRAEELGLPGDRIVLSCKVSDVQDLIAVYRELARRCDYPLHLGLTEAGMGSKGIVASTAAMAVLLQEGIGDTIRVSLTPEPGGDRTREVVVAQELLQSMGMRSFTPMVAACPGCGRTTSTTFQELAESIQSWLRAQMPTWRARYPGVEAMQVAVMGCVVNGPGESKLANIGISLPGTGETPSRPSTSTGRRRSRCAASASPWSSSGSSTTTCGRPTAASRAPRTSIPIANRFRSRRTRRKALMVAPLQAVRGMNDVLPDEAAAWEFLDDAARDVFRQYGYRNVRLPIVEPTALFVRGIGDATDIVEHEMYTFEDKLNGESLTLRPEATAGIVRAAIEHNLTYERPQRVWTAGPMFRHERPQKGRYRQFHQYDVEALGFAGPDVDAEQIVMLARLWKALDLDGLELRLNSIGDASERQEHRNALVAYFTHHRADLDADSQRRLGTNPLRILDSKNPALAQMIAGAPKLVDRLGTASGTHFAGVQALLTQAGIPFVIDARLVRGLDYYNRTVFEWVSDRLGAQATVAGGGRYDGFVRAARRQADAGHRICDRHRAACAAAPGGGNRARVRPARLCRPHERGRRPARDARERNAARCGQRDRRQRRRRQHEIADEEGRCQRRRVRAHHR